MSLDKQKQKNSLITKKTNFFTRFINSNFVNANSKKRRNVIMVSVLSLAILAGSILGINYLIQNQREKDAQAAIDANLSNLLVNCAINERIKFNSNNIPNTVSCKVRVPQGELVTSGNSLFLAISNLSTGIDYTGSTACGTPDTNQIITCNTVALPFNVSGNSKIYGKVTTASNLGGDGVTVNSGNTIYIPPYLDITDTTGDTNYGIADFTYTPQGQGQGPNFKLTNSSVTINLKFNDLAKEDGINPLENEYYCNIYIRDYQKDPISNKPTDVGTWIKLNNTNITYNITNPIGCNADINNLNRLNKGLNYNIRGEIYKTDLSKKYVFYDIYTYSFAGATI